MTGAVDISREAVEARAAQYAYPRYRATGHGETATMLRALRAALDAAERERDHWKEYSSGQGALISSGVFVKNDEYVALVAAPAAADATGYARGVREAAGVATEKASIIRRSNTYRGKVNQAGGFAADMVDWTAAAILALLPAKKEPGA